MNSMQYWIDMGNSKPVAKSLAIIGEASLLDRVEGNSKGNSFYPFSVRIKDINGKIDYICHATELHKFAQSIK